MQIKYRPEIDGLRALAVLAVILYHAKLCEGGFLGVDVFFIISGYLITAIILSDLNNKSFSFLDFYQRRARRILPMLLFMTLATVPFAWYYLNEIAIYKYAQSILAVEFFVSNIWFAFSTNYFAPTNELNPLLHTWSLGVEEQFYLLWPLGIFAMWKYFRKHIVLLISFLIVSTLLLSQVLSGIERDYNFFLLPSRIWQLMSGALLAYLETIYSREKDSKLNIIIPPICLLILLVYLAYIPIANNPNLKTCVPAIATLGLIWFAGKNDIATKILTNKLIVLLGMISYSAYLWHQPILVFLRFHNLGQLSQLQKISYIPITLLISYFSWKFIETPMRDRKKINIRDLISSCILMMLVLAICAVLIIFNRGFPERFNIPKHVRKTIIFSKLKQSYNEFGDLKRKQIDFLIYGDSHAAAVYPAIYEAAINTHKHGIISFIRGCAPVRGSAIRTGSKEKECSDRNHEVFAFVKQNNIRNVILVGKWLRVFSLNKDISAFNNDLRATLDAYKAMNVNLFIFLQVPAQNYDVYGVYNFAYKQNINNILPFLNAHSITTLEVENAQLEFLNNLQPYVTNNITIVDPEPWLCNQDFCSIGTASTSYYADFNHLSPHGAIRLVPLFEDLLKNMK